MKAHKSPHLARLQLELGAIGITCAKLGEAEVMVAHGIGNVLVANQLSTPLKCAAALQREAQVILCVDDREHVRMASAAAAGTGVRIPLLIEVDIGMGRAGVRSGADALAIAGDIAESSGVGHRAGRVTEVIPMPARGRLT